MTGAECVRGELGESDGLFFIFFSLSHWKSSTLNTAIADKGRESD